MNPVNPHIHRQTPLYQPNFNEALSPRAMFKEPEKEKPKVIIPPKPPIYDEMNRDAYKDLTDDQKNLMCAGIAFSANWLKFLRPYLETYTKPVRRTIKSDEDYYTLLNENAIAIFAENLISTIEGRAQRAPSQQYTPVQEEQ